MSKGDVKESVDPARIAVLRELERSGAAGLVQELITLFLGEVPRRLRRIQSALTSRDREIIRKEAHLLSGGAANLGARLACKYAKELEARAEASDWSDPSPLLLRLEAELSRVCEILSAIDQMKEVRD